jgi:hypothetical protein
MPAARGAHRAPYTHAAAARALGGSGLGAGWRSAACAVPRLYRGACFDLETGVRSETSLRWMVSIRVVSVLARRYLHSHRLQHVAAPTLLPAHIVGLVWHWSM